MQLDNGGRGMSPALLQEVRTQARTTSQLGDKTPTVRMTVDRFERILDASTAGSINAAAASLFTWAAAPQQWAAAIATLGMLIVDAAGVLGPAKHWAGEAQGGLSLHGRQALAVLVECGSDPSTFQQRWLEACKPERYATTVVLRGLLELATATHVLLEDIPQPRSA